MSVAAIQLPVIPSAAGDIQHLTLSDLRQSDQRTMGMLWPVLSMHSCMSAEGTINSV